MELPCKIGSVIYFVYEQEGRDGRSICLDKGEVLSFSYDETGLWFRAHYNSGLNYWHSALSIGENTFLSREEAEAKFREMENSTCESCEF